MDLTPSQTRLLRLLAGPILGAAALTTEVRMGQFHTWSHFARFVLLVVFASVLYALAIELVTFDPNPADDPEDGGHWRVTYTVSAVLLFVVSLYEFVASTGAKNPTGGYNLAFVLGFAAVAAAFAAARQVPYSALLTGLLVIAAWIFFWSDAISHPKFDDFRWVLLAIAAILAFVALRLYRAGAEEVDDVATAAGIAGLLAGVIGSTSFPLLLFSPFSALNSSGSSGLQGSDGWQLYLFALALFLIWWAVQRRTRGPAYVAAVGVIVFAVTAGIQVPGIEGATFNRSVGGPAFAGILKPSASLLGWPLILLVLGIAALVGGWTLRTTDQGPPT